MDLEERVPPINGVVKIRVRPEHYLRMANTEQQKGNYIGALQYYLLCVTNVENPDELRLIDVFKLTKLLINVSASIGTSDFESVQDEIMKCYLTVLNTFPENALLLNAFGLFFFAQGEYTVARTYFQRSAATGYLPGEKNYLYSIWQLIPRWHFRMLNDQKRNTLYKNAITNAINKGFKNVYDIGTGCGLLSILAAKTNDASVITFEENKMMSSTASKILRKNNVSDRVKLMTTNSNSVTEPPAPCNLIVTEIFDAAIFGEHCLKSISHAINTFVSDENFRIIPASATLYVTGFECEQLLKKSRYSAQFPELGLNNLVLLQDAPENYDYDFLRQRNVRFVTETKAVLNVNFYDKRQLKDLLELENLNEIELECVEDGYIHGLAFWFDLHLDEENKISTHPKNEDNKCWEQAYIMLENPIAKQMGDRLNFFYGLKDGQNNVQFSDPLNCDKPFKVSNEIITFLNDAALMNCIKQAVEAYEVNEAFRVVDFNIFPLFGFLMAKTKGSIVYHIYRNENDLNFFNKLLELNGISAQKMVFIPAQDVDDYKIHLEKPDVVFTDCIQTDGSWNIADFVLENDNVLSVPTLPKRFFLKAQLISSEYLDFCNKVDDKNVFGLEIAEEFNQFSGTEHAYLEKFDYEQHSLTVTFDISDLEQMDFHAETLVTKTGTCNSIFYWFELEFSQNNTFSTLNSTHYQRCCTLLPLKDVKEGEKIMIHVIRYDGHMKVYCD